MVISWLPDTFRSDWNIKWDNGLITIVSNWECTTGHIEYILNENNVVTVTVDKFIVEWKSILETIVNCLNNNNCNEFNVVGFNTLIRIYNRINGYGVLYRD